MQMIPEAVAYPIYAGVSLTGGSLLNYAQSKPSHVGWWAAGQGLVMAGVMLLALMQKMDEARAHESSEEQNSQSAGYEPLEPVAPESVPALWGQSQVHSTKVAVLLCVVAGCSASLWSPLSTYARKSPQLANDPYLTLFLFGSGQICSYPTVALITSKISGTRISDCFRDINAGSALFGLVCGLSVSIGYLGYFLGSSVVSPTVCFGISACNPVLALSVGIIQGGFRTATSKVKVLLATCVVIYLSAIGCLVQAE